MSTFSFDHIVHYVKDPISVIPRLWKRKIHSDIGGEHQRRPTHNVLSYFGLSYIEFIGTSNKEKLQQMNHGPFSMIQTIIDSEFTEGFKRFVLRTDNINKAKSHFLKKGLLVHGPIPLSRKKPDGTVLEWKLLFIGDDNSNLEYPYIIQWGKNDELLKSELIKDGTIIRDGTQPKFSSINIVVNHLTETVKRWSKIFSLTTSEKFLDDELQAKCQTLHLNGGNITFCKPINHGPLAKILQKSGEIPFQVNLFGSRDESFKLYGGRYKIIKS